MTTTNTDNASPVIDPQLPQKAMRASCCYMGLGQFAVLKQRFRGILLMLFEAYVLIDIILGLLDIYIPAELFDAIYYEGNNFFLRALNGMLFFFLDVVNLLFCNNTIIDGLRGLITLGDPSEPGTPVAERDHSIFMMINGLIVVIFLAIFIFTYVSSIFSARRDGEVIVARNKFPSKQQTRNDLSQNAFPIIGITPAIIMMAFFTVVPLLFSALVAFTNYSSPDHIPPNNLVDWVGFENFHTMFSASSGTGKGEWLRAFGRVAGWTLTWAVFATFSCFFVGFFFSVVLLDKRIKIPHLYRTVFILPYAIPQMLSLFVWANLLNGTMGPINVMLQRIGLSSVPWLSDPGMAKVTLILVNIWIGFPYSMILITSSMTAISNSLYEAAGIDGASRWVQFKSITFPMVMYQLKPTLIMQFAGNINSFGAIFFLTGGGPALKTGDLNLSIATQAGSTDNLITWIYKLTMNSNEYNIASVLSILVFIVLVPFGLYNFMRTKSFKEGEL
ncbi:carbohydrate ABC transporter permease [uncultured Treponema sp.]|uniref:carbohydrate ABC transporter permease n=1 Tax=uncultured Treponema sp. TaxID=162155 RepID=UPI0025E8AE36|nr:sugar ABC transporter permease [uncultured Treponema sp.]